MKRITNILLIVLVFEISIPRTVLHITLHIPDLIAHLHEHQEDNKNISLIGFIVEHTGTPHHKHKDKHAHDNLPFSHNHQSFDHNPVWNLPVFNNEILSLNLIPVFRKTTTLRENFHQSEYLHNIWQPPKVG